MLAYETYRLNFNRYKQIRKLVPEDISEIIIKYLFQEKNSFKTIIDPFRYYHIESMVESYINTNARDHFEDIIEDHMAWDDFTNLWSPCLWHINLDPSDLQQGQHVVAVANVGSINIV